MIVGGAGRAMTLLATIAPNLADRLFAATFYRTAFDDDKDKREIEGGFYRPGGSGEVYGDQSKGMRRRSAYTAMRRHPAATAAGMVALGGAIVAGMVLRNRWALRTR